MQGHPDLVDDLTLVALVEGEVMGCIMSTTAHVVDASGPPTRVVAVGPVGPVVVVPASS